MKLTARFESEHTLKAALESVGCGRAVVYSAKPLELEPAIERPSRISLLAVLGALAAGIAMTGFMLWTQGDYPLVTGGMPLKSLWPIGVITYESTMLGAVIGTLLGFLIEGRFFQKKSGPGGVFDPGKLFLQFSCNAEEADGLTKQLHAAGAVAIERE